MVDRTDFHLVYEGPPPLFMGELPRDYADVPASIVVNLCGVHPDIVPLGTTVLTFTMLDTPEEALLPTRQDLERFLSTVRHLADDRPTYWHCHAGLNRSGFAVVAYMHLHLGLPVSQAIESLRQRRSAMVLCNPTFEKALRTWYGREDEQEFVPIDLQTWLRERLGRVGA